MPNLHKRPTGRNLLLASRQSRLIAITLAGALLLGAGVWRLKAAWISQASQREIILKHKLHEQVRAGLGSEVRFASPLDSAEQVANSIATVDKFVYGRSGLKMSKETKARLAEMEQRTLKGSASRISIDDLTQAISQTALERLSSLSDQEIEYAGKILLSVGQGVIHARASGGRFALPGEFSSYAKTARGAALRKDASLHNTVYSAVGDEVNDRITFLAEALPDQFDQAKRVGVTPLQALLIAYSVAADDLFRGSQADLQKEITWAYEQAGKATSQSPKPEKAYGPEGYLFPTPLNIAFTQQTMQAFLDRLERGGAQ